MDTIQTILERLWQDNISNMTLSKLRSRLKALNHLDEWNLMHFSYFDEHGLKTIQNMICKEINHRVIIRG